MRASCHTLSDHLCWCRAFRLEDLPQTDCPSISSHFAHGKVAYLQKTCSECLASFSTNSNLEQHASSSGHTAFSCTCGALFSRASTLTRHINSMIGPSFPCDLCDDKAFPRLDKLGDHLRRWHRLGVKAFDQYKGGNSPTNSVSLATGGMPLVQNKAFGQAFNVAPGLGPVSMFGEFPSGSDTAPDASSAESSASPGSSTVSSDVHGFLIIHRADFA